MAAPRRLPGLGLEQVQELFLRAITWPTGVGDFLAAADQETRRRFEHVFDESAAFGRVARLDVYANAYFYRLLSALGEMFPRLRYLAGDASFHNLVTDYLLACPPKSPDLRREGEHLEGFLEQHELGRRLPLLVDVACVEAQLNRALDCPDEDEAMSRDELARLPLEAWPGLRFGLSLSTRRLALSWNVPAVFECCDRGEREAALEFSTRRGELAALVGRRGHAVYVRRLAPVENQALAAFERGLCFEAVCSELAVGHPGLEAARVVGYLRRWLDDGALGRVLAADT